MLSYIDVLLHKKPVGPRVAIVGAGGIGFDVAEYLVTEPGHSPTLNLNEWLTEWGVADPETVRGGVVRAAARAPARQVTLLAAQEPASSARTWARPPAGSTARRCR